MRFRPLLADLAALLVAVSVLLSIGGVTTSTLVAVSGIGLFYFVLRVALPLDLRERQRPPGRR